METVQYKFNNREYLDAVVLCNSQDNPKKCLLYVLKTDETCDFLVITPESVNGKSYPTSEGFMNQPNIPLLQKSLRELSEHNNKEFQQYLKLKKKYEHS